MSPAMKKRVEDGIKDLETEILELTENESGLIILCFVREMERLKRVERNDGLTAAGKQMLSEMKDLYRNKLQNK